MSSLEWLEASVSVIYPEKTWAFKMLYNSISKDRNQG